jgi:hypothetical protein
MIQDKFLRFVDIEKIAMGTFPDATDKTVALETVKNMGRHSYASFDSTITNSGWKDVPVSWMLTLMDFIVPTEVQRKYIETIEKETGKKVDVHELQTGHGPATTAPEKVAEIVVKILEAGN